MNLFANAVRSGWITLLLLCLVANATLAQSPAKHVLQPPQDVLNALSHHCMECHGNDAPEGNFSVERLVSDSTVSTAPEPDELASWLRLERVLINGQMPPADAKPIAKPERATLTRWISNAITSVVRTQKPIERMKLRRLNNVEYSNTMRDLLGIDMDFTGELPADSRSDDGFVNEPSALLISSEHLQSYLATARAAMDRTIVSGPAPKKYHHTFTESQRDRKERKTDLTNRLGRNSVFFAKIEKDYPEQGTFAIRVKLSAELPAHVGPPILQIDVGYRPDTQVLFRTLAEVEIKQEASQELEFHGRIENFPLPVRGQGKYPGLQIKLRNSHDDRSPKPEPIKNKQPGEPWIFPNEPHLPKILIESMEFRSPINDAWPPQAHRAILFDSPLRESDPTAYAEKVLAEFVPRAFRRPIKPTELNLFIDFYKENRVRYPDLESAMRETLAMVLIHPDFLFLNKTTGNDLQPAISPRTLDDWELASRLSYFLWSTIPDEALQTAADSHRLHDAEELTRQVDRMLVDHRATRMASQFVDQWLCLDRMERVAINPEVYPKFDSQLKRDMRIETQKYFQEVLDQNLSAMQLLKSDFAMLNEPLARHYGIAGVLGREFRRVVLEPQQHRGSLLSQASVLLANSTGSQSHPIRRAVWVRDRLLNDPPESPPADVPSLERIDPNFAKRSIREQLDIHRDTKSCNACHRSLDPWGFALENFDAVGLWRTESVNVTAQLPSGVTLDGFSDLQNHLLSSCREQFARSLVNRLTSYALGRKLDVYDRPLLDDLCESFAADEYRLKGLIRSIVRSRDFQEK